MAKVRKLTLPECLVVMAIVGVLWYLTRPLFEVVRDRNMGTMTSANNLGQLILAAHDEVEVFSQLPAAATTNSRGELLLSWRVSILPFINHEEIYRQFKLDEPWDGPHNKTFARATLSSYAAPYGSAPSEPGMTIYQGFVGPGTAFERPGLTLKDFPDGTANTIWAVEAASGVPWSKPADLPYSPDRPLPMLSTGAHNPPAHLDWLLPWTRGANAAFVDGSVRFLRQDIDPTVIRALITRNGGETVDLAQVPQPSP
jgi:prepilin-type processing-associated H-X9-DG protein